MKWQIYLKIIIIKVKIFKRLKKEVIKIINKTMKSNSKQIFTDDLIDEILKEINSKKQKSVLEILNQHQITKN